MTTTALPPVLDPERDHATQRTPWVIHMPTLLRVWGVRSVLSIIDQGLTASVGFGVNVLLARWMAADVYGAFAVAFAGFLFASGFYNAILLEPLTVLGPSMHAQRLFAYFRKQFIVHVLLVGALSAIILAVAAVLLRILPGSPLPSALFGSGLALPFLLLIWLVRRMCYVLQRPAIAVFGSIFYVVLSFSGLSLLHRFHQLTPFSAFILTGTASLLAAGALWIRMYPPHSETRSLAEGLSWQVVLRENWRYGRWLVGSTALNSIANQTQMFLVAGTLGLGAAGVLRAMQIPALALVQIIAATGLLVLPAFSYDFGVGSIHRMRRKATLVTAALTAGSLSFAGLLAIFATRADQLLFGGRYGEYAWLMPILALVPATQAMSAGYSLALRASQRPHFDLVASAISAPVALVSVIVAIHWWGLPGATVSMVLSCITASITTGWIYRTSAPQSEQGMEHA